MEDLIQRIGVSLFTQIVIELWNSVFLLLMIFSLNIRILFVNKKKNRTKILYTKEIVIFYNVIFIYNLINVLGIIPTGSTSLISFWLVRIADFLYYVLGAFQTLFFLQLIKKYIAEKTV